MSESQNNLILDYLMAGQSLTPIDALNMFGCFRLSARVKDLRNKGYDIRTETEKKDGKSYARYYLAREVKQLELIA